MVFKLWGEDTSGAVACATRCPDVSTACHVRLDQRVGHSNPSSAGSGTLGDLGAQPDGGEGRLDGVGRTQVDPVLGQEGKQREQPVQPPQPFEELRSAS